jgi:hypothetical protein
VRFFSSPDGKGDLTNRTGELNMKHKKHLAINSGDITNGDFSNQDRVEKYQTWGPHGEDLVGPTSGDLTVKHGDTYIYTHV